ncbi:MAG: hypothetical protein KKA12_16255 [Alphaproteobacteria bacterium]|nr:hypothetical protein [Alphaproteobacteria bacterium]
MLAAATLLFPVITSAQSAPNATQQSDQGNAAQQPPAGSVGGMGDINLYPKRIVIDGRQRIATVGLYNKTAATGDYQIAVNDMVMMPDGQIVALDQVADPDARARVRIASPMLRWSPRRVTLRGNEAQTIRIMARTPPDLPPGEYRSHFVAISAPPPEDVGFSIDQAAKGPSGSNIGVKIVPRFGISIPIILRVGETTLTSGMRDPAIVTLENGARAMSLTIIRTGTRSSFGDIAVTAAGVAKPVAIAKGVGVYTEVDARNVMLQFDPETDPRFLRSGAKLTITYTDDDFEPGKVLFKQDFTVP